MSVKLGITGVVTLDIIEDSTGRLLEHWEDHNDIVPYGFGFLLRSASAPVTQDLSQDYDYRINQIVFGSNGTANAKPNGDPGYNTNITFVNAFHKDLDIV